MGRGLIPLAVTAVWPMALAAQSSFPELSDCARLPFDTEGACTAVDAYEALEGLEPQWGYQLRGSAGLDAFAIVSVLGELRAGLEALGTGDCTAAEMRAVAASEIWTWYVSPTDDMNEQGAIDFAAVQGFFEQTVQYLSNPGEGACP